jgi:hypothetical protein
METGLLAVFSSVLGVGVELPIQPATVFINRGSQESVLLLVLIDMPKC